MNILICAFNSLLAKVLWTRAVPVLFPNLDPLATKQSTVLLVVFLVQYSLLKIYRLFIYPYYVTPLRNLPGPKDHHFLLGQSLRQFLAGDPREPYVSWMKCWPDADMIRYFGFGHGDAVVITGLDALKEVVQTNCYAFTKPAWYRRMIFPIVGRGLVFLDGEEHKRHLKILSGAFALSHLKKLIPRMEEKAVELCNHMDAAIGHRHGVINLIPPFSKTTLDVICSTVLGIDFQSLGSSEAPFHELYRTCFDPPLSGLILTAINVVVPIRWIDVGQNRKFNRAIAQLHALLRGVIRQRIVDVQREEAEWEKEGWGRKDLLTRMVQESTMAGANWTEEDFMGHVLTFMAAGHETTSNAMAWAIHHLALNPSIQDRLRAEILETVGPDGQGLEYAVVDQMKLLNNVFRETVRVKTPAAFTPREAARDVTICGTVIPKGTTIMLVPSVVHRNSRIWGASADVFDPDRWGQLEGEAADPRAFATFLFGPRGCPGQVFMRIEWKVMLISMLRRFRFEALSGDDELGYVNPSVVLRASGGLRVVAYKLEAEKRGVQVNGVAETLVSV